MIPGQYGEPLTYAQTISCLLSAGNMVNTLATSLRLLRDFLTRCWAVLKWADTNPVEEGAGVDSIFFAIAEIKKNRWIENENYTVAETKIWWKLLPVFVLRVDILGIFAFGKPKSSRWRIIKVEEVGMPCIFSFWIKSVSSGEDAESGENSIFFAIAEF